VAERAEELRTINSPRFRDLPHTQVVPLLADEGRYLASEFTLYRLLRAENQLAHREASQPRVHKRPKERTATGSNQVWSWDITFLHSPLRGDFYNPYLFVDVWSRKIVVASLSCPRVHDDKPFSEALFRTVKYRPGYSGGAFENLGHARLWVRSFLAWYNERHLHGGISFVTPDDA
jgi:transposase InsO family protein